MQHGTPAYYATLFGLVCSIVGMGLATFSLIRARRANKNKSQKSDT
jgi:hypothetical protein